MYRGTTPTISFKYNSITSFDNLNITAFYITFVQNNEIILEKELSDLTINGNIVSITLTQEETLLFKENDIILIQSRIKIDDKAIATKIIRTNAQVILKEGVI